MGMRPWGLEGCVCRLWLRELRFKRAIKSSGVASDFRSTFKISLVSPNCKCVGASARPEL